MTCPIIFIVFVLNVDKTSGELDFINIHQLAVQCHLAVIFANYILMVSFKVNSCRVKMTIYRKDFRNYLINNLRTIFAKRGLCLLS